LVELFDWASLPQRSSLAICVIFNGAASTSLVLAATASISRGAALQKITCNSVDQKQAGDVKKRNQFGLLAK
jgi:hypothetical protein